MTMPASIAELRAAEREVEREWQWLHDALKMVARARAEGADAVAFRRCRPRPWRSVRGIELSRRIADIEGPPM